MLQFGSLPKTKKRTYQSLVRQRHAGDTRRRIVEATRRLVQSEGYAGMTIEAIAQRAEVSAQSVYAIFKSKTGILAELLAFGDGPVLHQLPRFVQRLGVVEQTDP